MSCSLSTNDGEKEDKGGEDNGSFNEWEAVAKSLSNTNPMMIIILTVALEIHLLNPVCPIGMILCSEYHEA